MRQIRLSRVLAPKRMTMSCESAFSSYLIAQEMLQTCLDHVSGYASSVGARLPERPMMVVSGDVNSWRRYVAEVEVASTRLRAALDEYLEAAKSHAGTEP
jgi:hypothetical protein